MMMPTFVTQVFQNLQNVNQQNMNLFFQDKDEKLTSYFQNIPCICSGVGNYINKFGQAGTSNSFTFIDGVVRFADQPTVISSEVTSTFASISGSTISITASTTPPGQLYVVAVLTQTQLDAYKVQNTAIISPTAMTLTQIAAQPNPLAYLPLFAITHSGSIYTVTLDSNCVANSGFGFNPSSGMMFPNGVIVQWGVSSSLPHGVTTWTFPVPFPIGSVFGGISAGATAANDAATGLLGLSGAGSGEQTALQIFNYTNPIVTTAYYFVIGR